MHAAADDHRVLQPDLGAPTAVGKPLDMLDEVGGRGICSNGMGATLFKGASTPMSMVSVTMLSQSELNKSGGLVMMNNWCYTACTL